MNWSMKMMMSRRVGIDHVMLVLVVAAAAMSSTWVVRAADDHHPDGMFPSKRTVIITNGLEGGVQVKLRCRSKDDDLGVQVLGPEQSFAFSFWPNLFFRTLFYCGFEWPGSGGIKWYDIYVDDRDFFDCQTCKWLVKPYGPCRFYDRNQAYDICSLWH